MNSFRRTLGNALRAAALVGCGVALSLVAHAQSSLYFVGKNQIYRQTGPLGPVAGSFADPNIGFAFNARAGTPTTLAHPSGSSLQVVRSPLNNEIEIFQLFTSKGALDAAFPNAVYRMNGAGIPQLTFNLASDNYPATTPGITTGTWNSGGMLVVNPAQANNITFTTFSGWGTTGAATHMSAAIHGMNDSVSLEGELASIPIFGLPAQSTPFTSITVPPNTFTNGRVYEGRITFDVVASLDTTSIPGGGAVGLFTKDVYFFIAALAPGTVVPSVTITGQPTNQSGSPGGSATFSVNYTVGGTVPGPGNPVGVFWNFNGRQIVVDGTKYSLIAGTTNLRIANLTEADVGNYTATLVNPAGVVTTTVATLALSGPVAPAILLQPVSKTIAQGSTVVFTAVAGGSPVPALQWRRDGVSIPGATGPTLVLSGTTGPLGATPGQYSVIATNSTGNAVSSSALLNVVVNPAEPGRLINLSILTSLDAGETMTMGTVLGGPGTSGTKPLLARAAGPSLQQLGVTAFLPDPTMALLNTATNPAVTVATNNDWAGSATLSNAFTQVGAFGYIAANSRDAAIYRTDLPAGPYTVQVTDTSSGGTGIVIAELYDATPASALTPNTPRLINVSVLKRIPGGGLTAGFVIGGTTAKTVLIRAVGPTLGGPPFGLTGLLVDPQLALFSGPVAIAINDDWGGDAAIADVSTRVGAFALANPGSRDAAILMTLNPGSYTAEVRGNGPNNTGSLAIVEVYEVP